MKSELTDSIPEPEIDGGSLAAVLAAGIGAFAMGLFVILHVAGLYSAPGLYGPAGGVSGRTAFAVVVWLSAWAILHLRWKGDAPAPDRVSRVVRATLALVVLGLVATFPPLWGLL